MNIKDSSDTDIVSYTYDALNRRICKTDHITVSNTRTYYYSDNRQVLTAYDSTNTQTEMYIWGNYIDEAVYASTSTGQYYYTHDHLYSPAALIDSSGSVIERYEYDAYGKTTILSPAYSVLSSSQYGNPYTFTGRRLDVFDYNSTTGDYDYEIMYYRARYYDTDTGRFIQPDPLRYVDGMNLYLYVLNNPIGFLDFSGKFSLPGFTWETTGEGCNKTGKFSRSFTFKTPKFLDLWGSTTGSGTFSGTFGWTGDSKETCVAKYTPWSFSLEEDHSFSPISAAYVEYRWHGDAPDMNASGSLRYGVYSESWWDAGLRISQEGSYSIAKKEWIAGCCKCKKTTYNLGMSVLQKKNYKGRLAVAAAVVVAIYAAPVAIEAGVGATLGGLLMH